MPFRIQKSLSLDVENNKFKLTWPFMGTPATHEAEGVGT
jgi:hypothetical protein